MDVLEAIKGRRSIRKYTDQSVSKELIEILLDAARWAPTASNQQRWRFIVLTDHSTRELIRKCSPGIFVGPPVYVVICAEETANAGEWDRKTYLADCSIAAQNMMLAAHALGLGSCVILSYSPTAIQEILDLPESVRPMLVVTLGHPAEDPEPPARRPLDEIAYEGEYGREWVR